MIGHCLPWRSERVQRNSCLEDQVMSAATIAAQKSPSNVDCRDRPGGGHQQPEHPTIFQQFEAGRTGARTFQTTKLIGDSFCSETLALTDQLQFKLWLPIRKTLFESGT